ncbi:MAG: hypothetical protein L3J02_06885, partial [Henriciella sp.]|nr:hypothetical protein [Henriciella sp.]
MSYNKEIPIKGDAVKKAVANIIKISEQYYLKKVLQQIYGFIDLTSLNVWDTPNDIRKKLINPVNDFEKQKNEMPNVAGICVYPKFTELVHN